VSPRFPAGTPFPLDAAGGLEIALLTDLPEWPALLERVVHELYLPSFPNKDEREDPEAWMPRLSIHAPTSPQPSTHIFVAGARLGSTGDGRQLDGFLIAERYPESWCALATYLAVAPRARGRHVASRLVGHAVSALARGAGGTERPLCALFAEITDPHKPKASAVGDFDAFARADALSRMGWQHVPVDYVQPALGGGRARVRHLMLWAYPLDDRPLTAIPAVTLREFLREFYQALGVERPDDDPDFQAMTHATGMRSFVLEAVGVETPRLAFDTYGVAFHYVLSIARGALPRSVRSSVVFRSFERDILSQSFRERPPLWSAVVALPAKLARLELILPNAISYEAEGTRKRLLLNPGAGVPRPTRRRAVRLAASLTVFSSPDEVEPAPAVAGPAETTAVLHLVLTPDRHQDGQDDLGPDSVLSEWDLLTLIKLWEGGEGIDDPDREPLAERVRFEARDGGPARTLAALAREVFRNPLKLAEDVTVHLASGPGREKALAACLRAPRVGTVQVLTKSSGPVDWKALYGLLNDRYGGAGRVPAARGDDAAAGSAAPSELDRQSCAVGGMLQGLLDFPYIAPDELSDVFQAAPGMDPARRPVRIANRLVLGIHKGTLLCIMDDCRVYRRVHAQVGISPYLILPHAVLLCNGHLLEVAQRTARQAAAEPTASTESRMRDALQGRYLFNVFHYPLERYLFEAGMASRGLVDLKASLESQLAEVSGKRRAARDRRERRFERGLTQIGLAFAALQLLSFFSLLDIGFDPAFLGGLVDRLGLRNVSWLGLVRILGPVAVFALVLVGLLVIRLRHPGDRD
jgi:hypothetical protein